MHEQTILSSFQFTLCIIIRHIHLNYIISAVDTASLNNLRINRPSPF
jgi:hypothetical protein